MQLLSNPQCACFLPLCPLASWPEPAGCGGWSALHGSFPWRRMPSPDSHERDIPLLGHLDRKNQKEMKRPNKEYLQYSPHDYKATSVYITSSHCHCWTAMWWTTSMPPTCHSTLKRKNGHYKFSTVEQLPWQLVVLISMLQRVRGESLIISAWQRGPTDRAKVKHKSLCSTWEQQLLISSCSAQSCVKLCGGEKSGASLCYSVFFLSF